MITLILRSGVLLQFKTADRFVITNGEYHLYSKEDGYLGHVAAEGYLTEECKDFTIIEPGNNEEDRKLKNEIKNTCSAIINLSHDVRTVLGKEYNLTRRY